jgi:hypothetical protein
MGVTHANMKRQISFTGDLESLELLPADGPKRLITTTASIQLEDDAVRFVQGDWYWSPCWMGEVIEMWLLMAVTPFHFFLERQSSVPNAVSTHLWEKR